jgi:hypothetical protein
MATHRLGDSLASWRVAVGWAIRPLRGSLIPVTCRRRRDPQQLGGLGVEALPRLHSDPFDRILIAQAPHHGLTLVTVDDAVRAYDVPLLAPGPVTGAGTETSS